MRAPFIRKLQLRNSVRKHQLLNSVELVIRQPGDYKLVRQNLSRNHPNFVYFDPPYRPLSATSSFKEYSNNPFEDRQQEELKQFCDRLSTQNCLIMQSNSDSRRHKKGTFIASECPFLFSRCFFAYLKKSSYLCRT